MILKYQINFLDYWHVGSGVSQGALSDAVLLKDKNGVVYIPGKTIKGLARNIAYENNCELEKKCFGDEDDVISKVIFKNAVLSENEYKSIVKNSFQKYLYDSLTFTKIGKNGVAEDDTLREIEVCVPITLQGEIIIEDEECVECITESLKQIKHIGLMRNRGLGRCYIEIKDEK
jgi:CRISPR/Cas system CSM-associated protein Csm5 (group 7 of RAMP superfamily)